MCPVSVGTSHSVRALKTGEAKLWLLLVGVNQYQDAGLPNLSYSVMDCQGLSEALMEATQAFPQKELRMHHDGTAQPPVQATVRASLEQIVARAQAQDMVLLYFSGHGVLEPQSQQAVLCLADTQKDRLLETGWSLQELLRDLSQCAARQQLVWLDACHSGGMTLRGARDVEEAGELPNPTLQLVNVLRQRAAQSSGFYAFLSCDQDQRSWEFPQLGHGVFTYYLMQGLRGEAADAQGVIEADSLYRYVYYQTLQYIDKTNQQLRLINQQKRSRGETQLQSEYPLQTPKRIVEGVGEIILGLKAEEREHRHPRQAIVVDGLTDTATSLSFSKMLRGAGDFELSYWPQPSHDWASVREAIQGCLKADEASLLSSKSPAAETATALLYLRGQLKQTETGESLLVLPEGMHISRSWLRLVLRHSAIAQHIIILDCPGAPDLEEWVEDLQLGPERGQCLMAAAAPESEPDAFAQALLETLADADPGLGLPVAGWMTQLQGRLAIAHITPHFWLSGSQGVIEVLPGKTGSRGAEAEAPFDLGLCPYMGLRAFGEDDASFFFGREALVQRLLRELNTRAFLAVVGASGSGKSSVVQAGLMAQLRQGKQLSGSESWWVHALRPGAHPLQTLAQRLTDPGTEKERLYQQLQIEGLLHLGPEGFVRWLRSRPEPMVVLVVDQFEELFTLASSEERQQFLDLVLGSMEHARDRFKLVITLRTDFMAPCLEVPALAQQLQQASVLVPPVLAEEEYRQIILRPAEKVGLAVESELVEVLLQDLSHGVGDLPLLEFVLEQIWEHRQPGQLTLQVYQQQVGGLKGALERKAQAVYEALDAEGQACARWIFLNLTQLGEGTEDTRRRVSKSDLVVAKYPESLVEQTLQALTAAKLVVVSVEGEEEGRSRGGGEDRGDGEGREGRGDGVMGRGSNGESLPLAACLSPDITVEVAHEILIRHWSTLRWWLEENRVRLRSQRQIEQAALAWRQSDRQPDFLLRGVQLDAAAELYVKYTDELSREIQEFIEAGLAAREAEEQQTRKRLRQAQRAIALIAALGLGVAVLAGVAYGQRQQARLREVEALNALSTSQLSSHQSLEAILTAVRAGRQLQAIPALRLFDREAGALWAETTGTLQQAVSLPLERNRLEGHSEQVNAVAWSPNGQLLASGSDDGMLRVWQNDGTLLQSAIVDHHPDDPSLNSHVWSLAFSPDSQLIAVAQTNGQVKLWRPGEDAPHRTIDAHRTGVLAVAWSPNGQVLATASRDGLVKLWNVADGSLLKTLAGHRGWVNTVSWSPDGRMLASGGEDQIIKGWDVGSGKPLWGVTGHGERVTSLVWSPDGQWLASGGGDRTVKLWRVQDRTAQLLGEHADRVTAVAFSPDGKSLLSAGADRTLQLWEVESGAPVARFEGHGGAVLDAAWSPDGHAIASASADKTVRLWQVPQAETLTQGLYSVGFSPDGQLLAGAGWDGTVELWRREGNTLGPRLRTLVDQGTHVFQVSFSPDQRWLASASDDGVIRLWNPAGGTLVRSLMGHEDAVMTVAFSPDSQWLLSGSDDRTLRLWNPANGELIKAWIAHEAGITALAWHPNQRWFASGSRDQTVKIWDVNGNRQQTLAGHGQAIAAVAFSPDGQLLASSAWDNTIKLWRVRDGALLHTLTGHQNGVTSLAFTSDGQVLISGSADQTLKLWNPGTGELLKTLLGHTQTIHSFNFSPDGKLLASSGDNLEVRLWDWDLADLLEQGCDHLADYLETSSTLPERDRNLCEGL